MQKEKPSTKSSPPAAEAKPKPKRLRKVLIIGGIGIATLGLGYLAWRQLAPKPMETDEPGADPDYKPHNLPVPQPPTVHATTTNPGQTGSYRPDTTFPLTIYTKGEKVKNIQKALNYKFRAGLTVDGEWGPKTEAALKANGQPTVISQAQYEFLLAAMKKLGLAGHPDGNIGRMAMTRRACTALTQEGRGARLNGGWLAGSVIAEGGGRSQVVTDGGNFLTFDTTDLIFA
jgi:hypothetical protein